MKYKILTHSYKDAMKLIADGLINGTEAIAYFRCAYVPIEEDIIHIATAFEMADLDLPVDSIKFFTLYQVIE